MTFSRNTYLEIDLAKIKNNLKYDNTLDIMMSLISIIFHQLFYFSLLLFIFSFPARGNMLFLFRYFFLKAPIITLYL